MFCRYIHAISADYIRVGTVVAYMEDLVIPLNTEEEAVTKFRRLLKLELKIRCKIQFLGFTIENGTIKPGEDETRVVKKKLFITAN